MSTESYPRLLSVVPLDLAKILAEIRKEEEKNSNV